MADIRIVPVLSACLVVFVIFQGAFLTGVHCDAAAAADSTAAGDLGAAKSGTASLSSYGEFSEDDRKLMEETGTKQEFQAEVGRLMDIIINSLYSKKEIFLRELISNASDALDKIRFLSLTDPNVLGEGDQAKLEIRIEADKKAGTITITDTGIGMTKADLVNNLGTIAKSGTSSFLEKMSKEGDMNLIGQFGVGFYSVYLIADHVTVVTKNNDDDQHVWVSSADASFTVSKDPRGNTLKRGTSIIMKVKEDATEFLETDQIKTLIKRYSEFINFPIFLKVTKEEEVEVPDDEADTKEEKKDEEKKDDEKKEDDVDVSDVDEEEDDKKDSKPKTKKVKQTKSEWELINDTKAIWVRSPSDVKDEEYDNFFKSLTKEFDSPLDKIHFTAEGEIQFRSILFIPKKAPSDLYDKLQTKQNNLRLYVRRVFISDEFDDLMPRYLSFIRGVVDSEDLPLNVSREMLQQSRVLKVIKKKLVSKALDMMKKLAESEEKAIEAEEEEEKDEEEKAKAEAAGKKEEEEKKDEDSEEEEEGEEEDGEAAIKKYKEFFDAFGKTIKLGIIEDTKNRKKLAKLLRFESTHTKDGETVSLARYVKRMKDGQKHIYYIAGENKKDLENSPFLEKLKKRGYEVLFMTDPIDEYAVQHMDEYEDHKLMNATKEDLKFGDKDDKKWKKRRDKAKEDLKDFIDWYKKVLGDKIEKIVISNRLTTSPTAIVTGTYGYTANMERLMKAQALNDPSRYNFMASKKTLEINPYHPIIVELAKKSKDNADDDSTKELAFVLYDSSLITAGFDIDDQASFSTRMMKMLRKGLDIGDDAKIEEEAEEDDSAEDEKEEADKDGDKKEEL
jgi:heat shock protein 90kDa beta